VDDHEDSLHRARQAYAAQDWRGAADSFDAVAPHRLTADDLAAYADAVWWLGRVEDALRLDAAACDALVAESRPADAAGVAFRLGVFHVSRGDEPQGMGWFSRSKHLLEGVRECRVHGLLLLLTGVEANLVAGQPAAAVVAARQIRDLGRRLNEPDLVAVGLNGEGRALIKSGAVADGLALLDEAMVTVLEGRLDPFMTGVLYCHTIAACHEVGDVLRMTRWTELAERWLTTVPAEVTFGAMCAVHRAQLQLLRGAWDQAELGALHVVASLDVNRLDYAAQAWYVVAEVRRLRGEAGAAEAYGEAHARGYDPQPGRALLRLADGDAEGALASVFSAVAAAGPDPLRRAPLCAALVEIAIAAGHPQDAAAAASELAQTASTFATSGLEAMAATARGAVLLAEGNVAEALPVLRDACRRWYELGSAYDAAGTCVRLAEAYRGFGDAASADAELARAEAVYERLGARRPMRELPNGLTQREYEVLTLVADGRSNREIGAALFISDRTVARHLTNIYNKIGVTSRTQAARYAIDHQTRLAR
jgi:DNA-binding NarL/FixJ family response regulator